MKRFERMFGILLRLHVDRTVSAVELAAAFGVSRRTIYRDMEILGTSGVPIYAEKGREGGFHMAEGYFLPPLMFTRDEAVVLLTSLTLLRSLPVKPFSGEIGGATRKLLSALPDRLRNVLSKADRFIGFETLPHDVFHPETNAVHEEDTRLRSITEEHTVDTVLRCIFEGHSLSFDYRAPHRDVKTIHMQPVGLFLDRGHWYLVGALLKAPHIQRLWRADRVLSIHVSSSAEHPAEAFDVSTLLERQWLASAMATWRANAPVKLRLTRAQALRLQEDWYYRYAQFEALDDAVVMTFGEAESSLVFDLLRWLGPGAELIEPKAWRDTFRQELVQMLATYAT